MKAFKIVLIIAGIAGAGVGGFMLYQKYYGDKPAAKKSDSEPKKDAAAKDGATAEKKDTSSLLPKNRATGLRFDKSRNTGVAGFSIHNRKL